MSNRYRSTGSTIVSVIAVILVLLLLMGFVGLGFASDWFTDWSRFTDTEEELSADEEQDEGGMIIGEGEESGVSLLMTKLSSADYDEYGISPLS